MARPRYKRNHKERTYEEQKEYKREKKKSRRLRCVRKQEKEFTDSVEFVAPLTNQ